jgi:hypothetical protein
MSQVTELASAQLTHSSSITVELIETDENLAVVIITWPDKATVIHPRRSPLPLTMRARIFAAAAVRLASIKRELKL